MEKITINPNKEIKMIQDPYPVWIIDNILNQETPHSMISEWPKDDDERWFKGYAEIDGQKNILEQGMRAISSYEKMPPNVERVMRYFHGEEFTKELERITGIDGLIPDETLQWSGLRMMLPESWQLIHSDARKNPKSGKRKELTVLYYLNENYDKTRDEGCLELWNDDMTECVEQVEPLFNRMVIFKCTDTSYHGVPLVKGTRRFVTFSVVTDKDGSDRAKALFVRRPEDEEEVTGLGISRSRIVPTQM